MSLFPYKWYLKDGYPANGIIPHNKKAFVTFACGGGSTMGLKLAGYDVIGCNEIDPKMMACYIENHKPKYSYLEDIRIFKNRTDLPHEMYDLDLWASSPPCSSFSMAGNREKDWGKEKKFKEGQAKQVLDTLFFDDIELVAKLQPKVVIYENVKGLLLGKAKDYLKRIYKELENAGYFVQHYLLDASKMGVPQRRERVFIIGIRNDLKDRFIKPIGLFGNELCLDLKFNEKKFFFGEIQDGDGRLLSENMKKIWNYRMSGDISMADANFRLNNKRSFFSQSYLYTTQVAPTITSHEDSLVLFDYPKYTSKEEVCQIGTYPIDYNFNKNKPHYLIGMSVPPVMMAQISHRIYEQILSKI